MSYLINTPDFLVHRNTLREALELAQSRLNRFRAWSHADGFWLPETKDIRVMKVVANVEPEDVGFKLVMHTEIDEARIMELAQPFGEFQYGDAQGHKRIAFAEAIIKELLK